MAAKTFTGTTAINEAMKEALSAKATKLGKAEGVGTLHEIFDGRLDKLFGIHGDKVELSQKAINDLANSLVREGKRPLALAETIRTFDELALVKGAKVGRDAGRIKIMTGLIAQDIADHPPGELTGALEAKIDGLGLNKQTISELSVDAERRAEALGSKVTIRAAKPVVESSTVAAVGEKPAGKATEKAAKTGAEAAKSERSWYKFATHDVKGVFSGKRTLAFAAGAAVVAGAAYALTNQNQERSEAFAR